MDKIREWIKDNKFVDSWNCDAVYINMFDKFLTELEKTHSIVPNEPTDLQIQEGRYKIPLGGAHLATDRDMVLVYKAMIGVNDEPINTSKPDDSILKQIDSDVGYKEGEE